MIAQTLLYFFIFLTFISGLGMLLFKHPMRVALSLVTVMLSLASIFALLGNHVLAVFQVLIYVGAIMVFMIYVIMLLNPRDHSMMKRFSSYAIGGGIMLLLSLLFLAPKVHLSEDLSSSPTSLFTVSHFSKSFLNDYYLFFELTSVLLVVAVVAAVAVIKGRKNVTP